MKETVIFYHKLIENKQSLGDSSKFKGMIRKIEMGKGRDFPL